MDITYIVGYVDPVMGFSRFFVMGYGMSAHGFSPFLGPIVRFCKYKRNVL
jgi:hypothetical protein